jgi:uncharacterized membrane protein
MVTYLFFPFFCALIYPLGMLLLKRVLAEGVSPWTVMVSTNLAMGTLFLPLLFWHQTPTATAEGWQPLLAGLAFFLGQVFTFLALSKGDASVVAPILGTKVIFVAALTTYLDPHSIPLSWWAAAGLTTLAICCLSQEGRSNQRGPGNRSVIIYASLSAAFFAMADVCTQFFTPSWGVPDFLPRLFGTVALLSLPFFLWRKGLILRVPSVSRFNLALGALLLAVQAGLLCFTLGFYGHATAVNVIYNLRGLVAILLVWFIGHWFANRERERGSHVMRWRLAGAILLLGAIGLVLHQ